MTPDLPGSDLSSPRRWWWLRLLAGIPWRGLLVFTALLGLTGLWVGWRCYHRSRARHEIVLHGGSYWENPLYSQPRSAAWTREWLPRWIHEGLEPTIVIVLTGPQGDAAQCRRLRWFPEVVVFIGSGSAITDEGLEHLSRLPRLGVLELEATRVTDAGLRHLRPFTELELLDLSRTAVGGPGLVHLDRAAKLQVLSLNGTQVTDAGLKQLPQLPALEYLNLRGTRVTDQGLRLLPERLPALRRLDVEETGVTPEGIAWLRAQCPEWEILGGAESRGGEGE